MSDKLAAYFAIESDFRGQDKPKVDTREKSAAVTLNLRNGAVIGIDGDASLFQAPKATL